MIQLWHWLLVLENISVVDKTLMISSKLQQIVLMDYSGGVDDEM